MQTLYTLCDMRLGLLYLALTAIAWTSIQISIELNGIGTILSVLTMFLLSVSSTIIIVGVLVNHVSKMRTLLRVQVSEYFNLINIMREGVLVLIKGE